MKLLIMKDKAEYDSVNFCKLHNAEFACYGEGNHFVIVKDLLGDRMGARVTAPMLANILAQM